ncbi:MAG: 6,7-dimethyl-8-ribityllumazine synthase [Nitrospinota bacterium]|nr:MAG: 6,7-dimethyl-8-ribityllumazine synthase [Nitrospinota bacterium]
MARVLEGKLWGEGYRFGLVVSRFNNFITERLLEGALDALRRHGTREEDIEIVRVPGSFEIPYAANRMAQQRRYHAVICLGALIRGATPHFDYIAAEVTKGIANISLQTGVPVLFGVLTTDNIEQAIERAGSKLGNKGWEAAMAALEMVNLFAKLDEGGHENGSA